MITFLRLTFCMTLPKLQQQIALQRHNYCTLPEPNPLFCTCIIARSYIATVIGIYTYLTSRVQVH